MGMGWGLSGPCSGWASAGLDVARGWGQRGASQGSFSPFLPLFPPTGMGKSQKNVNQGTLEVSSKGSAANVAAQNMPSCWVFSFSPQKT